MRHTQLYNYCFFRIRDLISQVYMYVQTHPHTHNCTHTCTVLVTKYKMLGPISCFCHICHLSLFLSLALQGCDGESEQCLKFYQRITSHFKYFLDSDEVSIWSSDDQVSGGVMHVLYIYTCFLCEQTHSRYAVRDQVTSTPLWKL